MVVGEAELCPGSRGFVLVLEPLPRAGLRLPPNSSYEAPPCEMGDAGRLDDDAPGSRRGVCGAESPRWRPASKSYPSP